MHIRLLFDYSLTILNTYIIEFVDFLNVNYMNYINFNYSMTNYSNTKWIDLN